jgi:hypothetical protein
MHLLRNSRALLKGLLAETLENLRFRLLLESTNSTLLTGCQTSACEV